MDYINTWRAKSISYYCVYCFMLFQSYLFSLSIYRPWIEKFLFHWMNDNVMTRFNLSWWICVIIEWTICWIMPFLCLWLNGISRISLFIINVLPKIWNSLNRMFYILSYELSSNWFLQRIRIKKRRNKRYRTIIVNSSVCY